MLRYTQRVQRILAILAQNEAKLFHAEQLLPEHIMLALLKEGSGQGYKVLQKAMLDPERLRLEIEAGLPRKQGGFFLGDIPPSPRGKKILDYANEEARGFGHAYIGTEHLLLACCREEGGLVGRFLAGFNVSVDTLRDIVLELSGNPGQQKVPVFEGAGRRKTPAAGPSGKRPTPTLDEFSRDLTALAVEGKLDPVVGREKEIRRVIQILARRTKNNPVLIGEPGVGKTAIVEGLAESIIEGTAPEVLLGKRVLTLDLASIIAGTKYRGEFEERLKRIMREIITTGNIVLFIDELHTLIGAGGAEGAIDASNMLKPALSRGELQCIGATTLNEYKKYIERDAALERRFQTIYVDEPSVEEAIEILRGIKDRYEKHHNVSYTREALEAAAFMSRRYITERYLPDKAIDLVDEAGSRKRIESHVLPLEVNELEKEIEKLNSEKTAFVTAQNYEKAASVRDAVKQLKAKIDEIKTEWRLSIKAEENSVGAEDIQQVISDMTGIPLARLALDESEKLLGMETALHERVIGQNEAIGVIASAIRRSRVGLSSPSRPMGSFIFLGPTGVGKSLLAKSLAEYLFGNTEAIVRIDMSDYMEKHTVSRLVGAPPGYIGYEEGGLLTEKIRRRPYSVVLLDEIEKAHPDVFNILLQVLEEGQLQDNLEHTVSFRNTVLIMTSNAGAREISRDSAVGFQSQEGIMAYNEIKASALNELKRLFRPEFLNRVDELVVFHSLTRPELAEILDILLAEVGERLAEREIGFSVTRTAKEFLLEKGFEPRYGARPLRRIIQQEIEEPLSIELLRHRFTSGDKIIVSVRSGKTSFLRGAVKGGKEEKDSADQREFMEAATTAR
ncbi:MAG: ATP-dependent Clp protease ATP-binding subunit [Spirochaetales bacterium]|nr:ATP-dependent Clp protease ATP-binding subunit [Spirochaetales bacterium]